MVDSIELKDQSYTITLKAQLDEDWADFEKYVSEDENHTNPNIDWPNGLWDKVTILRRFSL